MQTEEILSVMVGAVAVSISAIGAAEVESSSFSSSSGNILAFFSGGRRRVAGSLSCFFSFCYMCRVLVFLLSFVLVVCVSCRILWWF